MFRNTQRIPVHVNANSTLCSSQSSIPNVHTSKLLDHVIDLDRHQQLMEVARAHRLSAHGPFDQSFQLCKRIQGYPFMPRPPVSALKWMPRKTGIKPYKPINLF